MMKRTHVAVGIATTLPLILSNPATAVGLVGSVAPDFDIQLGIKHRTLTHSLLMAAISTSVIFFVNNDISVVWCINYLLHLLLDSITVTGVPLLYPNKKIYGLRKIKTRGAEDYYIQLLAIAFIVFVYMNKK